jgi:hypothetical protein
MSQKNLFCYITEEIYNNVIPHWSAVLISCNHSITRLISFTKNASNQRSILSVYGPRGGTSFNFPMCMIPVIVPASREDGQDRSLGWSMICFNAPEFIIFIDFIIYCHELCTEGGRDSLDKKYCILSVYFITEDN